MSLILEALRKSEAERRRGDAPAVTVELPPPRSVHPWTRSARLLPWLAAVALLALAAILAGWHASRSMLATDAAATALPYPPQGDALVLPRIATAPPVVAAARRADPAPAPSPSRVAARTPAPRGAQVPAPITPASAVPRAPAPPIATPPPMATRPAETIASLGELDAETRRALPPLKLTMHMWNDDPARRFVILDGQRLREGDMAGPAVLTRITPDAVLLDFDGRSIRVPLR